MIPGNLNPRQLNQIMKRLGINIKEIENVEKVIIQTKDKEYIFDDAQVTMMDAQGQKTYQIAGRPKIVERKKEIPDEDVKLVAEKTGKTEEEARKALEETKGDIAEAIILLSQ
ncbi:MAG: nascent polypeptide-associated complex protein [Thermoplasmata archaeon]|nr:nascent polypeptide-associated complex protein [Thermoplasmata archaeon]RLF28846.1 MAG: nascent polypeptide-associated complex protein [Thermoplasmata archaeon]